MVRYPQSPLFKQKTDIKRFFSASLYSSRHPSPPYDNLADSWDDMPRQYLRKARKAVGLPSSSDVGYLAKMLSDLRASVEERVGPITSAGITTMNLVALYDEDLHDAFDYLKIEYLTFPVGPVGHNILYETSAAYAGYGFGLCADYKKPEACKAEQYAMPDTAVMAVLFTRNVLTVSLSVVGSVYALWEPGYRYLIDAELGYGGEDAADFDDDGGEYWEKVKMRLEQIMVSNPFYDRPAKVVLMGDCVGSKMFQQTLLTVLGEQMEELPEILSSGSEVVAARGVAETAKRLSFKADETAEVRETGVFYFSILRDDLPFSTNIDGTATVIFGEQGSILSSSPASRRRRRFSRRSRSSWGCLFALTKNWWQHYQRFQRAERPLIAAINVIV